jgi:hypothetical protein
MHEVFQDSLRQLIYHSSQLRDESAKLKLRMKELDEKIVQLQNKNRPHKKKRKDDSLMGQTH